MVDGSSVGSAAAPLAPGASGNTSTEDLLFATRPDWFTPTSLASMVEVTDKMLAEIGEPNRSRTAQGARSKAKAFDFGLSDEPPSNRCWPCAESRSEGITGMIGPAGGNEPPFSLHPYPNLAWPRCARLARCMSASPPNATELAMAPRSAISLAVVVAQLSDLFDADLLAEARYAESPARRRLRQHRHSSRSQTIVVGNTPGVLTDATADLTMLLILATARRAIEADQFTRSGQFAGWKPELLLGHDVSGATLGLAGFGRIARATALRAAAFGMNIIFCSHPPAGRLVDQGSRGCVAARQVSWNELVESGRLLRCVPLDTTTRPRRSGRARGDEADGDPGQHRTWSHHR